MTLNPKQQCFVEEYLLDLNASQAALRAGYAANYGSTLMDNASVKAEISSRIAARSQRNDINQQRVLQEIANLAFSDPRRLFDSNGAILPIQDWPAEIAAAVASIKVNEIKDAEGQLIGETKLIRFWDKGRQLELAAKHLGMLQEKIEINTSVSHLIRAGRQRIRLTDQELATNIVATQPDTGLDKP